MLNPKTDVMPRLNMLCISAGLKISIATAANTTIPNNEIKNAP